MRSLKMLLACFIVGLNAHDVSAIQIAITNFGSFQVNNSTSANRTLGWKFDVNDSLSVTNLGIWDSGVDGLVGPHQVGLWDSVGNLLGQTTVQAGTASATFGPIIASGQWRYEPVASIPLAAGSSYVIAGLYNNDDHFESMASSVVAAPAITFGLELYSDLNSGFVFPTSTFNRNGLFGPNFLFETATANVPEPNSMVIWGLASLAAAGLRSRRTK